MHQADQSPSWRPKPKDSNSQTPLALLRLNRYSIRPEMVSKKLPILENMSELALNERNPADPPS